MRRSWALIIMAAAVNAALQAAPKWPAIDPAEFKLTQSAIDPDAGVEILLTEAVYDMLDGDMETQWFVRLRVYSERGVEKLSKIELPYSKDNRISKLEVRTIKPDGTTVVLNKKEIYDRDVIKTGNVRMTVKSFSPPGIQPGVIVEYRYTTLTAGLPWYVPLYFQGEHPARVVRYKVRLLERSSMGVRCLFFNTPHRKLNQDKDGYYTFEMSNLRAHEEEPFGPPALQSQSVVMLYYTPDDAMKTGEYWASRSSNLYENNIDGIKPTKAIKEAVSKLVKPSESREEQIRRIYDFCRTKIVKRTRDSARYTEEQRQKMEFNRNATETLKLGHGMPADINELFVAMARGAGFDARIAMANDRNLILFQKEMTEPFVMTHYVAAVKMNDWEFFDPGSAFLPPGCLSWNHSDTGALVSDPKGLQPQLVPGSSAEKNSRRRKAAFELDEEGNLEGTVTLEYAGLWDADMKEIFDAASPEHRATLVREHVQETLKSAEVSEVKIENASDPTLPLKVAYRLRVPAYAERTGSRLIFQPAVFHKNAPPRFDASTRRTDIVFRYRTTEIDEISIQPPKEFQLEAGSTPGRIDLGMGNYEATIGVSRSTGRFDYKRHLVLNGVFFSRAAYEPLKHSFESVQSRDRHALTLRRKDSAPKPDAAAATESAIPAQKAGSSESR